MCIILLWCCCFNHLYFAFCKQLIENKRQLFYVFIYLFIHQNKMILFSAGVICQTVFAK